MGDGSQWGLSVSYSFEPVLLGTAGAVKKLASELSEGTFLVLYGDNFTNCRLDQLLAAHRDAQAVATIAVFDARRSRNSGIAGGTVQVDGNHMVERFVEGRPNPASSLVNAGIYALEPAVIPTFRPRRRISAGTCSPRSWSGADVSARTSWTDSAWRSTHPKATRKRKEFRTRSTLRPHDDCYPHTLQSHPRRRRYRPAVVLREARRLHSRHGARQSTVLILNRLLVENKIILHYTKSETVDAVGELKHELAREALKLNRITNGIELSSLADIPASTGLGSSSCYLVGLLTAIHAYRKDYISLQDVAEEACRIELDILKKGIGRQDQYMAAFGGLTVLDIDKSGKVAVRQLQIASWATAELVANSHIYYLNRKRDAAEVLEDQNKAMGGKSADRVKVEESLLQIKDIGHRILAAIQAEDFDQFGRLMDEHWQNKRRLSDKVSYPEVDQIYEHVKKESRVSAERSSGPAVADS